ncbi:MAG: hypothetical protein WBP41_15515 [Saprospiraceae bacterium]
MASIQQNRLKTIIALLNSNRAITPVIFRKLKAEFEQVLDVDGIKPLTRKNLLKVLHSTRGLDSTLSTIVNYHHLGLAKSLGPLIDKFHIHTNTTFGKMYSTECNRYKRSIADTRNDLLHTAGSYPKSEGDVNDLISEMESLISRVLAL